MFYCLIPIPLFLFFLGWTTIARSKNELKKLKILQPVTTLIMIGCSALTFLSPNIVVPYSILILAALTMALIGETIMIELSDANLSKAMIFYGLGLITYGVTFTIFNGGFHLMDLIPSGIMLVAYLLIMRYLWPGLKKANMQVYVGIYTFVWCFVVSRAMSTFFGGQFSLPQSIMLTGGTLLFFSGDLQLAIQKYANPKVSIFWGAALYWGGQILIALTPAFWPPL